jgi:hypothetical protein
MGSGLHMLGGYPRFHIARTVKIDSGVAIRENIVSGLTTGIRRITKGELKVVQFNCRIRSGFRSSRLPSIHFAG